MFLFQIDTDGDAFADGCALREISKMLHDTARAIRDGSDTVHIVGRLKDTNGNTCGAFRYIPETDAPRYTSFRNGDTAHAQPRGNVCECGAARVTCANCGAARFACASVCQDCGKGETS